MRRRWYWWETNPEGPPKLVITGGWRLYVMGKRWHHGKAGSFILVAGALLIAHDWRDRWWPAAP